MHSEGLGRGARFRVLLPLRAVFAAGEPASGKLFVEDATTPTAHSARVRAARILILDDDPDSLDLLQAMLEEAGVAKVVKVDSAGRALQALEAQRFDLVVSDIGMPEVDGYAFMRSLRARNDPIPAIALTAYARSEDGAAARAAGFQQHLAKPVNAGELLLTIEQLLG